MYSYQVIRGYKDIIKLTMSFSVAVMDFLGRFLGGEKGNDALISVDEPGIGEIVRGG